MKNLTKIQKLTIIFVLLAAVLSSCGEEEENPLDPEVTGGFIPNVNIEAKPQKINEKSQILLSWTHENPKVYEGYGYEIYRDGDEESYVSVGKSVKSYTDKNVKEGQEYTYKIVIKYRIGDSPVGIGSLKNATSVKARAPGELKSIEIIPPSGQIVVGESGYEFSAQGKDAYGNKWSIKPKWDVDIEKGEITEDGHFTPKKPGELTVKATYSGKQKSLTVSVEPGSGMPSKLVPIEPALSADVCSEIVLRARLTDANDNPSKGFTVSFKIDRTPPNLQVKEQLVPSDGKSITDENGIAKITLKLGSKAEDSGYEVQANFSGEKELNANFAVTATSGKPYEIQKHQGDNQSGVVGKKAENELNVKIVDKYDNPTEGVEVRWHFDGVPKDTKNHKLEPNLSVSDKYGIASSSLTYGTRVGNYIVSAYKQGLNGSPVEFSNLIAESPEKADKLIHVSPSGMKGTVGTVTEPLVVKLVDEFENPVEGKTIDFTLDQNRSISIDGEIKDSKTDADGKAISPFKIGKTEGKYYVNAKWSNLPKVTFEIEALADRESAELFKITKEGQRGYPDTDMKESLVVEVRDQYKNLIEDISVSFKIVEHPSGASGMSPTPATVSTDNNGRAEAKMHLGDKVGDYVVQTSLTDYPEKFVKFTATAIPPTTGDVRPKDLHFEKDEKVKELEVVREQGDETITWEIVSKSNWIVPEKNSDSFSGDSQKIDIAVNRANLPIGSEEGEIELKINNKEFSVMVKVDVAFTSRITVINPLDLEPVESATILWNGKNLMSDHSGQVELVITEQIEKISATVSKEGYLDTEFDTPLKEEILIELKPIPQLIDEISNAEFGELSQAAFSSDCSRLYVTDKEVESPQLFCINTSDNQITGSYDFPSGSDPVGVAVNPVTDEVYVALSGGLTREDSVFILNPNLEKVAEITVGNGPVDLAVTPDGKFLYVLNQIEETVSEVDIERRVEITPRIKVGGQPQDIVIDEQGVSAYVTNADDSSVSVVDLKFRQVDTMHVGSEPHGMALSENGEFLYTANYDGDSVSVIDTNSNMRAEDISVGNLPIDSCLSCLDLLFVANYIDGTVSIIDLESGKVADEMIELGYVNQAIVSTKDGRKIYVVHSNAVSVLGY